MHRCVVSTWPTQAPRCCLGALTAPTIALLLLLLLLLLLPSICWVQITRPNLTSSMLQQTLLRNLRKEAVLMSKLRHPNG
jgi:hypothetical protein